MKSFWSAWDHKLASSLMQANSHCVIGTSPGNPTRDSPLNPAVLIFCVPGVHLLPNSGVHVSPHQSLLT